MIDPISDQSGPPRFLLLTHRVPFPPDKGDRIRSYHLLEHLSRLGSVDLAYPADRPACPATREALGRLCRRVEAVPVRRLARWSGAAWSLLRGQSFTAGYFATPRFRARVERWLAEEDYDAVVCFSSGALPAVLDRGCLNRLVVDLVDVDSWKWLDYAGRSRGLKAFLFRLEGRRVRALERASSAARAVALATEPEAELYRAIAAEAVVEVIPNGVDLAYFAPQALAATEGGCVFVGQLDYRANVLSLEWFCQAVWPLVRARRPAATLSLVGRNPTRAVRRLEQNPGIEVVGSVADVRPYLARARLVLVPLLVARGVQNKVLEAMAMGRPVIASPGALEGLAIEPGRDLLRAAEPASWAELVDQLWDDEPGRAELGRAARAFVETHHQWSATLRRFDAHLGFGVG